AESHDYVVPESLEWVLMGVSVLSAVIAMIWASKVFTKDRPAKEAPPTGLQHILVNKWFVDEFYEKAFVMPLKRFSMMLWKFMDEAVIDRIIVGFGRVSVFSGERIKLAQTGSIQHYMFVIAIGLVITTGWIIYGLL